MKKTLLILGIVSLFTLPSYSGELTNMDAASRDYLIKHGHSIDAAEMVEKSKAAVYGVEYVDPYAEEEASKNVLVRWYNKFFKYFDPAQDQDTFMRHDIRPTPSYEDL